MLTKNIVFSNNKISKNYKKKKLLIKNILNYKEIINKFPLLVSLTNNFKYSYDKKLINKYKNYNYFNLVGMGGSILGAQAIYDFLKFKIKKKFFFINNLGTKQLNKIKKKSLNIVISKSGNTLETISNYNYILSKHKNKNIIITENKKNFLRYLSSKLDSEIFEHKNFIGGRYSVLSEVGMLPAELMGLNEKKFKKFNYLIKNKKFVNTLIKNVIFVYEQINKGKKNSVILNYDESSYNLFKWYQQLTAESLGKKNKGIFPIISSMPKDNHSLLQLYLDGPKDCFFTFFSFRSKKTNKINNSKLFDRFPMIKNSNFLDILTAQKNATQKVFLNKKIPFRSFEMINRNEESLGELFTFFILETILLGKLMKIDPFTQPSVEQIKLETKKFLKK